MTVSGLPSGRRLVVELSTDDVQHLSVSRQQLDVTTHGDSERVYVAGLRTVRVELTQAAQDRIARAVVAAVDADPSLADRIPGDVVGVARAIRLTR